MCPLRGRTLNSGLLTIGGALLPGLVLAGTLQGTAVTADFKGTGYRLMPVSFGLQASVLYF